jgi:hypothetical protein
VAVRKPFRKIVVAGEEYVWKLRTNSLFNGLVCLTLLTHQPFLSFVLNLPRMGSPMGESLRRIARLLTGKQTGSWASDLPYR